MKTISLRLPDDLHAQVKALAASEHRSVNAQIVALLEVEVERRQANRTKR